MTTNQQSKMDPATLETLNPGFKEAVESIHVGDSVGVYRHKDMQLAKTADFGPWQPGEEILGYVPNIKNITVEMISEATNIEEVLTTFRFAKNIGLVLMGREISRTVKPALIVLVTQEVYYVIDPSDSERGLALLKMALKNPDLTLWTTNGLFEADCLYHNYGIKLIESNAKCCLGLHLHLMKLISSLPQKVLHSADPSSSIYPERALFLARSKMPRLQRFRELLRTWLGLEDLGHFDFNPIQIVHLETRPLSETAINMIRRRCCLVLQLAKALEYYVKSEPTIMNRTVLESLTLCNESVAKLVRHGMNKDEKSKVVNAIYYVHLDTGSANLDETVNGMPW